MNPTNTAADGLTFLFRLGILGVAVWAPAVQGFVGYGWAFDVVFAVLACLSAPYVLASLTRRRAADESPTLAYWAGLLFVGVLLAAVFRGSLSPVSDVATTSSNMVGLSIVCALGIYLAQTLRRDAGASFRIVAALIAWMCVANLVLWLLGVRSSFEADTSLRFEEGKMLSALGLAVTRVRFPLAWGVNTFGVVAAMALSVGLTKGRRLIGSRSLDWGVFIGAPFLCLLLTDSRGPLLIAILSALAVRLAMRKMAWLLVLFLICNALILLYSFELSASVPAIFSRGQASGGVFSGREYIWIPVLLNLSQFETTHLLGFGLYGHATSGWSIAYAEGFVGMAAVPELTHTHNTYLQAIVDMGYIGLAAMLAFVVLAVRRLATSPAPEARAAMAVITTLAMTGFSEVTLEAYQPWTLLMIMAVLPMLKASKRPALEATSQPIYPQTLLSRASPPVSRAG